jgi:hypothetical protein
LTVKVRFLKEEQKAPEKCSYKEHEILWAKTIFWLITRKLSFI